MISLGSQRRSRYASIQPSAKRRISSIPLCSAASGVLSSRLPGRLRGEPAEPAVQVAAVEVLVGAPHRLEVGLAHLAGRSRQRRQPQPQRAQREVLADVQLERLRAPPRSARRPRAAGAGRASGRAPPAPARGRAPAPPRRRPRRGRPGRGRRAPASVERQVEHLGAGAAAVALGGLLELALDRAPLAALRLELEPVARAAAATASSASARRASARSSSARQARPPGSRRRARRRDERLDLRAQRLALRATPGSAPARALPSASRAHAPARPASTPSACSSSAIRVAGSGSKRTSWQRETTVSSTRPSASVSRIRCTKAAGSSSVLSSRFATSSFIVSTRSSTNTRLRASNGVRVAAATTGSSTSSTRITCAPVGRTQVRSGCEPCCDAQPHGVGIGLRPRPAARPRAPARRCACRCPAGRGRDRRARAPAASAAASTMRACGWSSVPASAALTRAPRGAPPRPRRARPRAPRRAGASASTRRHRPGSAAASARRPSRTAC